MKQIALSLFTGMALLAGSATVMAATMEITASFTPSLENPENNTFTNTTPAGGYCTIYPGQCVDLKTFSISMGGITASLATAGFTVDSDPRMGVYFKMPGAWRNTTLINREDGSETSVRFRVRGFGATLNTHNDWTLEDHNTAWSGSPTGWGNFVYAPAPCSYSGVGVYSTRYFRFMWQWPAENVACYKVAKIPLTGEPYLINDTSIMYELQTPEPLKLTSGLYEGTLSLTVGPGGDIDFGDNFQASDNQLNLHFSLSVNHELKLTTTPENQSVSLQPCAAGKICTADEGEANWERWMVTRITPQLTGRSNFNLTSSGSFTVFLDCADQTGKECALTSDNSGQQVPMKVMINLPEKVVDMQTGSRVSGRPLLIGKSAGQNYFTAKTYGTNEPGSIDFLVRQKDVDTMLSTRPDTYRGAVSVIFDPNIF
ncbi:MULTISPECIES: hypothetical protein [unclassified Kosakonia]|uniref:hypothetical protein n=1 Tax=unclassified Kosakonia TaxID=2632876 RepID=UPI0031B6E33A